MIFSTYSFVPLPLEVCMRRVAAERRARRAGHINLHDESKRNRCPPFSVASSLAVRTPGNPIVTRQRHARAAARSVFCCRQATAGVPLRHITFADRGGHQPCERERVQVDQCNAGLRDRHPHAAFCAYLCAIDICNLLPASETLQINIGAHPSAPAGARDCKDGQGGTAPT